MQITAFVAVLSARGVTQRLKRLDISPSPFSLKAIGGKVSRRVRHIVLENRAKIHLKFLATFDTR